LFVVLAMVWSDEAMAFYTVQDGAFRQGFINGLRPETLLRCDWEQVAAAIDESLRAACAAPGAAARIASATGSGYDPGRLAEGQFEEDKATEEDAWIRDRGLDPADFPREDAEHSGVH
jgi:hypothetical protein